MKSCTCKLGPLNSISAWQYVPHSTEKVPDGVKTHTGTRGTEALVARDDGIVLVALPMDWVVSIDNGNLMVLPDYAFRALFRID